MRGIAGLSFVAVFVAGAGLAGQTAPATSPAAGKIPFTISKETTVATQPLMPDGTVDYVAALNERYGKGATPENNGFVVWLKVVGTEKLPAKAEVLKMCGGSRAPGGGQKYGNPSPII